MPLVVRPCASPDDFLAMKRVLIEGRAASPHSGHIHVGDLDWWRSFLLRGYDWTQIAYLWEAGEDQVVGWSLFSPGYGAFDLFALADARRSAHLDVMLDWTVQRAIDLAARQGLTAISTMWVFDDDALWQGHLSRRGFAPDPDYALHYLVHALDGIPSSRLPDGFTVRHVGHEDVEARAAAHRAAFGSERLTGETYREVVRIAGYRPDLDVITVAPNGRIASFALGWLDEENRVGEFEPVGTPPDFRGQGLGRAALLEGLRRMRARGAQCVIVYVEADNAPAQALYRSVGFRQANTIRAYRKPLT